MYAAPPEAAPDFFLSTKRRKGYEDIDLILLDNHKPVGQSSVKILSYASYDQAAWSGVCR